MFYIFLKIDGMETKEKEFRKKGVVNFVLTQKLILLIKKLTINNYSIINRVTIG
jgi:hypothetical protein